MDKLTIIIFLIYGILTIYHVIYKKNIFSIGIAIFWAIIINFSLYMLKWSEYIKYETYTNTYLYICLISLSFMILMCISKSPINEIENSDERIKFKIINLKLGNIKVNICLIINIVYISLFFIENYMGSGSLYPNIIGIDIHTYSAPIISFITRAYFVILIINYFSFDTFKKKKYIIFSIFEAGMFIITRGARMVVFIALVQFFIFYSIYNIKKLRENKKILIKLILCILLAIVIGLNLGIRRIDRQWSKADKVITYQEQLRYTGIDDKLNIISWYYGYFPMSFANLDASIKNIDRIGIKTYGIYSLRPILVGMFQMDNISKDFKDIKFVNGVRKYYTPVATVPTGFIEFYLDFGIFGFIPIFFYGLIGVVFYNKIKNNLFYICYYSLFFGMTFMMSFQNLYIEVVMWYSFIYLFIIKRFLVYK